MLMSGDDDVEKQQQSNNNNDSPLLTENISNNNDSSSLTVSPSSLTPPTAPPPPETLIDSNNKKANSSGLSLRIKAPAIDNKKDVEIHVPSKKSNILTIKDHVRNALGPSAGNRYLRLICKGRLLAPDTAKLESFPIEDGDVVHAVLAAAGVRGGQQAALSRGGVTSRRYRGTGVGPLGRVVRSSGGSSGLTSRFGGGSSSGLGSSTLEDDAGELSDGSSGIGDDDNDTDEEAENGRERLGFDRLRSSGLSRAEITAIRSYFSRSVDRYIQSNRDMVFDDETTANNNNTNNNNNNEGSSSSGNNDNNNTNASNNTGSSGTIDLMRRRLLYEDAWMSEQGPTSEFRLNLNHNNPLLQASLMSATLRGRALTLNAAGGADGGLGTTGGLGGGGGAFGVTARTAIGTDRDFLWGFLLGFFVGFLMLVWVWMPTVPHKQKLGILTGISLQLAMSLLRSSGDDDNEDGIVVGGVDDYGGSGVGMEHDMVETIGGV